jgi:biopolymer transport protein ExbB
MSSVWEFFRAGGWAMWPLLAISLVAVALIIERASAFARQERGQVLALGVARAAGEGRFDDALRECRAREGALPRALEAVLSFRHESTPRIERRVEEAGQAEFLKLERGLWVLETATTISPLLGLLGTILGMIGAFNAIAVSSASGDRTRSGDAVLGGVGEALYATAAGIVIAVICFVAYNAFSNRLRALTAETELAVTRLLNVLGSEE